MKRFKNILVIHDDAVGSDDALSQASALARSNDAKLTIASVLQPGKQGALIGNEMEKRLNRLADALRLEGLGNIDCVALDGVPFAAIVAQVLRAGHDIVITSAGTDTTLRSRLFGTTAVHLVRKCPCPVWVLKPGQSVPYARILAAVPPPADPAAERLDRKIMDLATSLASRDMATFHVVHAWDIDGQDAETLRSGIGTEHRQRLLDTHEAKHRANIDDLLVDYPMAELNHRIHLPRDVPEQAISRLVDEEGIDLIVMGTVARNGIPALLLGNAVEQILNSVDCSVLAVKPDNFTTPVSIALSNEPGVLQEERAPVRNAKVA